MPTNLYNNVHNQIHVTLLNIGNQISKTLAYIVQVVIITASSKQMSGQTDLICRLADCSYYTV